MSGRLIRSSLAFVLLIALGITLFYPSHVSASLGNYALTTSPISVALNAGPGTSTSTVLQVQNNSKSTAQISVKLEEFKAVGSNGDATIFTPPANDPSVAWVHFSTTSFSAPPNVWIPVTMTINVPTNASLGYYYAVLFSFKGVATLKGNNLYKSYNAIFVLLNTGTKNEIKQLQITSFKSSKSIYNFLPANFKLTVYNPGNIFFAPQGDIYISRKPGGKTIDTLPINFGANDVLPGSSRSYSAMWSDGFPVYAIKRVNGQIVSGKNGQPIQQLTWNTQASLSKFRFGRYYANLVMVYNNGIIDVPITGQVSFWVIPWVFILLIILAIAILIVGWRFIRKAFKKTWHKIFNKGKSKTK